MIEIIRQHDGVIIRGHAGYAEPGQDIVCAAISALTLTFIASVEELTEDNIKADIAAGNTVIQYRDLSEYAQLLLNSFFVGLKGIADEYPQHVRIA